MTNPLPQAVVEEIIRHASLRGMVESSRIWNSILTVSSSLTSSVCLPAPFLVSSWVRLQLALTRSWRVKECQDTDQIERCSSRIK